MYFRACQEGEWHNGEPNNSDSESSYPHSQRSALVWLLQVRDSFDVDQEKVSGFPLHILTGPSLRAMSRNRNTPEPGKTFPGEFEERTDGGGGDSEEELRLKLEGTPREVDADGCGFHVPISLQLFFVVDSVVGGESEREAEPQMLYSSGGLANPI
ncbi:hypothetical protein BDN72DRAFT_861472 [Pluteus cervinus]|uniref:Uncharacterized protein n=1 Tax=Pluteus cervinus TaxID=181527 RepID=A0ACD3AFK9_9AGAR|nr:hypothetical protein BDN72DRAFT_861472 [Pluteus cervinus]